MPHEWIAVVEEVPEHTDCLGIHHPGRQLTAWHTQECLATTEHNNKVRAEWAAQWPNYCRHCEGKGMLTYTDDPSASGVSLSPGCMEFSDPCPKCLEEEKCPRCGGHLPDDLDTCPGCGWKYDEENPEEGMPAEYECYCYEATDYPWNKGG